MSGHVVCLVNVESSNVVAHRFCYAPPTGGLCAIPNAACIVDARALGTGFNSHPKASSTQRHNAQQEKGRTHTQAKHNR